MKRLVAVVSAEPLRGSLTLAAVAGFFACGYWLAFWLVRDSAVVAELYAAGTAGAELDIWTTLLGAIGGSALVIGALAVVGFLRLKELDDIGPDRRSVMASFGAALFVQMVLLVSLVRSSDEVGDAALAGRVSDATLPVTLTVATFLWPALALFVALRLSAASDNWPQENSVSVEALDTLRLLLGRLTAALGGFLTLTVIATGARRRALNIYQGAELVSTEQVLVYGGVISLVLGAFYTFANLGIVDRARKMTREMAPISGEDEEALFDQLDRRRKMLDLLGGSRSWKRFESSVAIASPLLTAAIATVFEN